MSTPENHQHPDFEVYEAIQQSTRFDTAAEIEFQLAVLCDKYRLDPHKTIELQHHLNSTYTSLIEPLDQERYGLTGHFIYHPAPQGPKSYFYNVVIGSQGFTGLLTDTDQTTPIFYTVAQTEALLQELEQNYRWTTEPHSRYAVQFDHRNRLNAIRRALGEPLQF